MSEPGNALPTTLREALRVFGDHSSPRLLAGLAGAALALRLALGDWSVRDAAALGLVVGLWPLQEWLIHVFVLHYRPLRIFSRTLDFEVPRLHREHHRDPWRLELVFIPIRVYLYVPIALLALFVLAYPVPPALFSAVSVYFALALHYEWVHFLVHTRYQPRTRHYQELRRNHLLHHFKNERRWFGVTMRGGDRLFLTEPDPATVPTSPSCRVLDSAVESRDGLRA